MHLHATISAYACVDERTPYKTLRASGFTAFPFIGGTCRQFEPPFTFACASSAVVVDDCWVHALRAKDGLARPGVGHIGYLEDYSIFANASSIVGVGDRWQRARKWFDGA